MTKNILVDAQEDALYRLLGQCLNDYISKNKLPGYRILRILNNMTMQVLSNFEREQDV